MKHSMFLFEIKRETPSVLVILKTVFDFVTLEQKL